jgi:Transposase DDE domain
MAIVASSFDRIKLELNRYLPEGQIESICRDAGHRWRERKLGPVLTIQLFVLQVLHCNTAIRHLRHLAKMPVKAASYCKARMRLPLAALQELLRDSSAAMRQVLDREAGAAAQWLGHRTFLVDGSSTIVPDTPQLQKVFKQPSGQKKGCGLPVPKVLGLFDACTGLIVEVMAFALYVHEQSKVRLLHPLLKAGDLLVADRGFCSFVHVALLSARQAWCVFRMHQQQIVNFRPHRKCQRQCAAGDRKGRPTSLWVKRLAKHDQLVKWVKPKDKPGWMAQEQFDALPGELLVRELRYAVNVKGWRSRVVTIATTLTDPQRYPKQAIAELYGMRWRVETHWGELKTTLNMRRIKCKTEAGVRKELAVYALVHNLVHVVMMQAALLQEVKVQRISFVDALRWLCSAEPGEPMPELVVNPARPGRLEPRVIKNRESPYTKMTKPRNVLRRKLVLGRS